MAVGVKVLLSIGVGLTVTVTFWVLEQELAVVVIAYVTTIGAVVVLVNVSLMPPLAPLPTALLIPATAARVQEKVAPVVALVAV